MASWNRLRFHPDLCMPNQHGSLRPDNASCTEHLSSVLTVQLAQACTYKGEKDIVTEFKRFFTASDNATNRK